MALTPPTSLDVVRFVYPEIDDIVDALTRFYQDSAGWTYWPARSAAMPAFSGELSLISVLGACNRGHLLGRQWNIEAGQLVWAAGQGREVKCYKIKPRLFAIRPDLGFIVKPLFFFVEDGKVKIFFLQPRRGYNPTTEGLGVLAVILRMTYKDDFDEFDVEILDLSKPAGADSREPRIYNFSNLPQVSEIVVRAALERFAKAFDIVQARGVQRPERRKRSEDDKQQPLPF